MNLYSYKDKVITRNTPRWIVFFIDVLIAVFSISLAYFLRYNFNLNGLNFTSILNTILFVVSVRIISYAIGGTYAGIVRYANTKDAERIFYVATSGSLFVFFTSIIYYRLNGVMLIPTSVIIIDYALLVFIMTMSRFLVKTLYNTYVSSSMIKNNVVIYGCDEFGIMAKHALDNSQDVNNNIVAFIDHNDKKSGSKLEGVKIYKTEALEEILSNKNIVKVIIAKKDVSIKRKKEIIETCLAHNVKVWEVPKIESWINGELSEKQIKKINIEDLLEREPIKLSDDKIREQVNSNVVMVTGAAGSIGSEIVRQIANYNPKKILLVDNAETPCYDIELQLRENLNFFDFEIVVANIRDYDRMKEIFEVHKPSLVYHAAAYKHVPMMEKHPDEAIKTNVLGTKVIADLSVENKVEKFVMVSTDKAVNPTNVMGASKRIAEIYIQSLNDKSETTEFLTTRFGNVLGSNGSVIPRFKEQIDKGGPITVTHPEITRYFMTIPEACQLVLQAAATGKGGTIFVFDMGESVKIVDLAKKMIKLSGLELGKDIHISFTGLRPGEKLYEELLNVSENTLPTVHPRIKIARVRNYKYESVLKDLEGFNTILELNDNYRIVEHMKNIVPEFKSKNSIYEQIDLKISKLKDRDLKQSKTIKMDAV